MLNQVDHLLALSAGETFCDCTLGGAGHSAWLGQKLGSQGLLIGIDQDSAAIQAAGAVLAQQLPNTPTRLIAGNFADLDDHLLAVLQPGVDAFLFDLGLSSHQIDNVERGFSYSQHAPLDMRMSPGNQTLTAEEVINTKNETDLARILYTYGEERFASRIARAIVARRRQRPFTDSLDLAETIRQAIPAAARRSGGNPAKRSFQALRIYVNSELEALEQGLEAALRWVNPGGRIAVLSYHSLEDRIVKRMFGEATKGCICPAEATVCVCGHESVFELLTRHPLTPEPEEQQANPRSSSARLRAIRRLKADDPGQRQATDDRQAFDAFGEPEQPGTLAFE